MSHNKYALCVTTVDQKNFLNILGEEKLKINQLHKICNFAIMEMRLKLYRNTRNDTFILYFVLVQT